MKNKIKLVALMIFAAAVLSFAACAIGEAPKPPLGSTADAAPPGDKQTYQSTDVIKKIDRAAGEITIDHQDIEGYMAAMEMNEKVGDPKMLETIETGDKVDFELTRTNSTIAVTKLTKIGEVALLDGGEIYQTNCATCHGASGAGAKKGISLIKGHALAHSETEHIAQVTNGERGKMPAFKDKLSEEDIRVVVEFVRAELQKDATPEQRQAHRH